MKQINFGVDEHGHAYHEGAPIFREGKRPKRVTKLCPVGHYIDHYTPIQFHESWRTGHEVTVRCYGKYTRTAA